jgi:hypothetical protein
MHHDRRFTQIQDNFTPYAALFKTPGPVLRVFPGLNGLSIHPKIGCFAFWGCKKQSFSHPKKAIHLEFLDEFLVNYPRLPPSRRIPEGGNLG